MTGLWEKQRLAVEKKGLRRAFREVGRQVRPDKRKSPGHIRKAKENAAEERGRKLAQKC